MTTIFVTGTDTGVGKTVVSTALVSHWIAQGLRTTGFKPVAAGAEFIEGTLQNDDARDLLEASNTGFDYSIINPCVLKLATAPHIAAVIEQKAIDITQLDLVYEEIRDASDRVVVEGAGGWQVPLNESMSFADWVIQHGWPILLVVNIKLGCLNHARLSYLNMLQQGGHLAGWVANIVSNEVEYQDEMIDSLKKDIPAPFIGRIPTLEATQFPTVGQYLDFTRLSL